MQRVLIIGENSIQQRKLCAALKLDRTVQLTTVNWRQITSKKFKAFHQADLIVLEDTSEQEGPVVTEFLISSLKKTGLPIVLLPSIDSSLGGDVEPLVINLTEDSIAKPGLAALINKIREQYVVGMRGLSTHQEYPQAQSRPASSLEVALNQLQLEPSPPDLDKAITTQNLHTEAYLADSPQAPQRPELSSKVVSVLTSMGRISKQLREPLSNMNLAIYMLGRAQSIEERDRYVKLLREEYQRELQLITELENLHNSLDTIL
ncbi:MAG: hypothetical protein AAF327_24275 [Cyanobacteria bacterium P01_A01_bin.37]